jgi:hypothetical protein
MSALGLSLTRSMPGSENVKMGYHIPPFSSVHHLHLHVLLPPYNSRGKLKYPARYKEDGGKKWGWFVTPDQVERILQNGETISIRSSASGRSLA